MKHDAYLLEAMREVDRIGYNAPPIAPPAEETRAAVLDAQYDARAAKAKLDELRARLRMLDDRLQEVQAERTRRRR